MLLQTFHEVVFVLRNDGLGFLDTFLLIGEKEEGIEGLAKEADATDFLQTDEIFEGNQLVLRELARMDDEVGVGDGVGGVNHAVNHHYQENQRQQEDDGLLVPCRISKNEENGNEQDPTLKLYFGVKKSLHILFYVYVKYGFTDGKTPLKPCKFRKKTENMVKRWVHIVGF